jgi:hypothetical protein
VQGFAGNSIMDDELDSAIGLPEVTYWSLCRTRSVDMSPATLAASTLCHCFSWRLDTARRSCAQTHHLLSAWLCHAHLLDAGYHNCCEVMMDEAL